jgi:hypothetical protein
MCALAVPAAAWGHAEWRPAEVPAGATAPLVLFVPPEKPGVENVRIDLEMLPGFRAASCQAPAGWTCEASAGAVSFVRRVGLAPESRFGVEMAVPREPGLRVFAVTQTYDDGTGVRWSGPPGDEFEGALLRVTDGAAPAAERSPSSSAAAPPSPARGPALAEETASPARPSPTSSAATGPAAPVASPVVSSGPEAPVAEVADAPVVPRSPGRFVVQEPRDPNRLRDGLAVLAAGGLLVASVLGHAAAAARRAGGRRAG